MAFGFVAVAYILALIFTAFLLFVIIHHVIAFDELQNDYKNPIDQCRSLNSLVLPEYIVHAVMSLMFLFCGQLLSFILNLPLAAYHVKRYMDRPVLSSPGLYDPTSIMNADKLRRAMREGWVKLAVYLCSFFYYLYCMIYVLVS